MNSNKLVILLILFLLSTWQVEKTREAKEKCGETLHESESQLSRATAELDVMKGQESERLKLAKIIADQFDMDKSLLVSFAKSTRNHI